MASHARGLAEIRATLGWKARLRRARAWLHAAVLTIRTRRLLAGMTAHELRDLGWSPSDAQHEANRAFWDMRPRCERGGVIRT